LSTLTGSSEKKLMVMTEQHF